MAVLMLTMGCSDDGSSDELLAKGAGWKLFLSEEASGPCLRLERADRAADEQSCSAHRLQGAEGLFIDEGTPLIAYGFTPEGAASVVFDRQGAAGEEERVVDGLIDAGDGLPPVVVAEVETVANVRFLDVQGEQIDYENQDSPVP